MHNDQGTNTLILIYKGIMGRRRKGQPRLPAQHERKTVASFENIDYQKQKRQQTTTNDYCRLQTFNQRTGLDIVFIFAA